MAQKIGATVPVHLYEYLLLGCWGTLFLKYRDDFSKGFERGCCITAQFCLFTCSYLFGTLAVLEWQSSAAFFQPTIKPQQTTELQPSGVLYSFDFPWSKVRSGHTHLAEGPERRLGQLDHTKRLMQHLGIMFVFSSDGVDLASTCRVPATFCETLLFSAKLTMWARIQNLGSLLVFSLDGLVLVLTPRLSFAVFDTGWWFKCSSRPDRWPRTFLPTLPGGQHRGHHLHWSWLRPQAAVYESEAAEEFLSGPHGPLDFFGIWFDEESNLWHSENSLWQDIRNR